MIQYSKQCRNMVTIFFLLLGSFTFAFTGAVSAASDQSRQETEMSAQQIEVAIVDLEESLRLAMLSSDVKTLDELISDNLVFTNHFGQLVSKESDLGVYKSKVLNMQQIEVQNRTIQNFDNVVAVAVCMFLKGEFGGSSFAGKFKFTRIWALQAKSWKIVAVHSSLLSEEQSKQVCKKS